MPPRAYVDEPMVVMVIEFAPFSLVKPFWPSITADVAMGADGVVMSMI